MLNTLLIINVINSSKMSFCITSLPFVLIWYLKGICFKNMLHPSYINGWLNFTTLAKWFKYYIFIVYLFISPSILKNFKKQFRINYIFFVFNLSIILLIPSTSIFINVFFVFDSIHRCKMVYISDYTHVCWVDSDPHHRADVIFSCT